MNLQSDALKNAGCKKLVTDKMSAARGGSPELDEALKIIHQDLTHSNKHRS